MLNTSKYITATSENFRNRRKAADYRDLIHNLLLSRTGIDGDFRQFGS